MTEEEKLRKREYMRRWERENKAWLKAWRERNAEKLKQQRLARTSRPEVKVKISEAYKRWRLKHPEYTKARWAEYYAKNKESLKAKRAPKSDAEKEVIRKRSREYYQKVRLDPQFPISNRARAKAGKGKRRAIILNSPVGERRSVEAYIRRIKSKKIISCYYCGVKIKGDKAHIDHITPLARGGAHSDGNLCAACPSCNLRKNDRTPGEFAGVLL